MTKHPIDIEGLEGPLFISFKNYLLSEKIEAERKLASGSPDSIAFFLHTMITDENGRRIKSQNQWDLWGLENEVAIADAYKTCVDKWMEQFWSDKKKS